MSPAPRARRAKSARPRREAAAAPKAAAASGASPLLRIARELRHWTGTVLGVAAGATDLSLSFVQARVRDPRRRAAIAAAGSMLRRARESAGITTRELGRAIDLGDAELLQEAELGKAVLPFEVILRLAGVLGRHDPVTFVMKLTRSYYPRLWKALDELGIGRLAVQMGRERELANLYRGNDVARSLSDEEFNAVLDFVKTGFDMAVLFHGTTVGKLATRRSARGKA
jgi:transcriptional regulator with XRE-family HTH domain